jgi:hypothetical protein
MTERERWIVYPLLFLALGAALRDKLVDRTTNKSIVCQDLLIVDEESTGPQSQRVLARIGSVKGKSTASMQINGDVEIVDNELSENSHARILATLGRSDPRDGIPSNGMLLVHGQLAVDGVLDANQYVWRHLPMVPVPVQVAPGVIVLGLMPALAQTAPNAPNPNAPKQHSPSQPPAGGSKKGPASSTPPSSAGKQSPSEE